MPATLALHNPEQSLEHQDENEPAEFERLTGEEQYNTQQQRPAQSIAAVQRHSVEKTTTRHT